MPLVTVTVRKPKTAAFTSAVLAAVHQGLLAVVDCCMREHDRKSQRA